MSISNITTDSSQYPQIQLNSNSLYSFESSEADYNNNCTWCAWLRLIPWKQGFTHAAIFMYRTWILIAIIFCSGKVVNFEWMSYESSAVQYNTLPHNAVQSKFSIRCHDYTKWFANLHCMCTYVFIYGYALQCALYKYCCKFLVQS